MDEAGFVDAALAGPTTTWDMDALRRLSALQVPDGILGRRRSLLRADAGQQWAQWFVEGLVDPRRYVGSRLNYARIFGDVLEAVNRRFPDRTKDERSELASSISLALRRMVEQLRAAQRRSLINRQQKSFLIAVAGDPARCWICGTSFDQSAINNFIHAEVGPLLPPPFIDILKPRGLNTADLSIQIDHVLPVALGGGDVENLALACGWCNRHKSAAASIYDVEGRPRSAGPNSVGLSSLPQPFWIIRQLGVTKRCEYVGGCQQDVGNSPMTVAPASATGALNPHNLMTTCLDHDPLRDVRFQPHHDVRSLWNK